MCDGGLPLKVISLCNLASEVIFKSEEKQSQRVAMETALVIALPSWMNV